MKERIFPMSEREAKEKGEGKASIYNRHCKFARRMLSLRTEAGLSQQKVADLLEVSKSTISLYESGSTVPDARTIYKLCDIYQVSADYLLCRTDYRANSSRDQSIEKYGFSEQAAENIREVQYSAPMDPNETVKVPGRSALDFLCSDKKVVTMCLYINRYRSLSCTLTPLKLDDDGGITEQLTASKAEAELALYCACEILKEIVRTGSIVTLPGLDEILRKTRQDRDEKTTE